MAHGRLGYLRRTAYPSVAAGLFAVWSVLPSNGRAQAPEDLPSEPEEPAPQVEPTPEHTPGEEEPPPRDPTGRTRIGVLVLAVSGVDQDTADALTELAISAVARRGRVDIVGKEELQARLGQTEGGSIECVSSGACLGRIGVELGVDELIAGTVGRRGTTWVFNLNRFDIRSGELAGRVFQEIEGDVGALADGFEATIPNLFARELNPATLVVSASVAGAEIHLNGVLVGVFRDEPVRIDNLRPGRHELRVSAGGYFDWERTVSLGEGTALQVDAALESPGVENGTHVSPLFIGGLVAAGVGAGLAIGFGIASQAEPGNDVTRAQAFDFYDARDTEALVANISLAVAGAGVVSAVIGLLLSDFSGDEPVATASISPDGVSLSYTGSL
jgi:hypothetical protein